MNYPLNTSPIALFARHVLKKPLYPYQVLICNAILESIDSGAGTVFTVMMARQMGKNQLSAILEAFLLATRPEGTIVKAAPTFKPQIINSRLRLLTMLDNPLTRDKIWSSFGYMIGVAPTAKDLALKSGPKIMLFSAEPESNVVGATASLLMEIDEAQDVNPEKFDKDFRPMASTTNATTVLYGTAWSEDTLLAMTRAANAELEAIDGIQRNFQFDWHTLATINPNYKKFVEGEIARLGVDHPIIQTQYLLIPISGAGYYFNPLQRDLLQGDHLWESEPEEGAIYIAGMDIAGEERPKPGELIAPERDSTVITIGRVRFNELDLPVIEVVHHLWWTGMLYPEQYAATSEIMSKWNIRSLAVDNTGQGAGLASLLFEKFGEERILLYPFSRPSKSKLAYQVLSMVNASRLKMYNGYGAPGSVFNEFWHQAKHAKYALPAANIMNFFVQPSDGHDDFLISLALLTEAVGPLIPEPVATFVPPKRMYEGESRY